MPRMSVARTTLRSWTARARSSARKPSTRDHRPMKGGRASWACRPASRSTALRTVVFSRASSICRARVARFSSLAGQDIGHGGDCIEPGPATAWYAAATSIVKDALTSGDRIGSYEVIDRLGAGRHGRGLPRPRHAAGPDGRAQGAALRRRPRAAAPARPRGARGLRPQPSEHRPHLRRRRGGRRTRARTTWSWSSSRARRCARRLAAGPPAHARGARPRRAARGRPGQGAPRRHRPSRPEARERDGHAGRRAEDPRLRPGQGAGRPARRTSAPGDTMSRHGTQAGMLMGTLEYMSPEQASGRPVDHRTDQFSLGLILYEMATGRPTFRRDTPAQVLAAVIERDPEPLRPAAAGRARRPSRRSSRAACRRTPSAASRRRTSWRRSWPRSPAARGRARWRSRRASRRDASSADLRRGRAAPAARPRRRAIYHVQAKRGVRRYDEAELAQLIRRGKLTGVELVRRDDEEQWQPLFESRVYRREVPTLDDPRDAARLRVLRAVGGHFTGFFITGVVMYATQGHFPFWLAIWGAVLAVQAAGRRARGPGRCCASGARHAVVRRRAGPGRPRRAAARPRGRRRRACPRSRRRRRACATLIEQRGGSDAPRLLAEVDGILKLTAELAARQADLEEQTSEGERAAAGRRDRRGPGAAGARRSGAGPAPLRAPARGRAGARGGHRQGHARARAAARAPRGGRAPAEAAPARPLPRRRQRPRRARSCPPGSSSSATRWTPGKRCAEIGAERR